MSSLSSIVSSLSDGKAAKRPSWNGYVKRADVPTSPDAYSGTAAYSAGDVVTYSDAKYVFVKDIAASATARGFPTESALDISTSLVRFATWVADHTYAKNDVVLNGTSAYICLAAHTVAAGESFSVGSYWRAISSVGYSLVFYERADPSSGTGYDSVEQYLFLFVPRVGSDSTVTYSCVYASGDSSGTVNNSKPLAVDKLLMDSLVADDWTSGYTEDYETSRSGSSSLRW